MMSIRLPSKHLALRQLSGNYCHMSLTATRPPLTTRNLQIHVTVTADRKVVFQLPDDVALGEADLTVIIRPSKLARPSSSLLSRLPEFHAEKWPEGATFSRSEIYGDGGR